MKIRKFALLPVPKAILHFFGVGIDPRLRRARMRGSVLAPTLKGEKKEGESEAGDAPPPAAAPAADPADPVDPAAPEPAPAAAAKPSVFDRAATFLKGKEAVASEISGYKAEIKRLTAELATANQTIATQTAELVDLRAGAQRLEAAISGLESEKKTVAAAVVDVVASTGVPQDKLPAADKNSESADSLSGADKLKHYNGLKGAARTKYFRAHKKELIEAQAAAADKKA